MSQAELLAACAAGDETAIELLGWRGVLDILRAWPARLDGDTLAPYAMVLGDEDPDRIVAAVRALLPPVSRFRPSASEILEQLRPPAPPVKIGARQRPPRPDQLPHTPTAVLRAAAAGDDVCECRPRPTMWLVETTGVLRCPDCGGLEVGQYESALETEEGA